MIEQCRFIRVGEAAERLGVSESTVRRCLVDGELEGIKIRTATRVDSKSVEELIKRRPYYDVISGAKPSGRSRWLRWRRLQDFAS